MMFVSSVVNALSIVGLFSVATVVTSSSTATIVQQQQQQQQEEQRDLQLNLIPSEVLDVIPIACRGDNDADSELQGALDCAIGNLLSCSGLVSVLDQFATLIPTSSANVNGCGDIEASFCPIATKCLRCLDEFDALARCIVDQTDAGVIDPAIITLINQCPLTCTGNPDPVPVVPAAPTPAPVSTVTASVGPQDLATTAIEAGVFTTLVAALGAAELVGAISAPNGPYTVFAPTDTAFAALPEGLVDCLLQEENVDVLTDILLYHVASGTVLSEDLFVGQTILTLLSEEEVTIGQTMTGLTVNDSVIATADVEASNGVIHIINNVLVPPSIDVNAFLDTCAAPSMGGGSGSSDLWGGDGTNPGNDGVGDGTDGTTHGNGGSGVEDLFETISDNPEIVSSTVCGFVGSFLGSDENSAGECENVVDTVVNTFFSFFEGSGW